MSERISAAAPAAFTAAAPGLPAPVPGLQAASPSAITAEEREALEALRRPPNLFQRFARWIGLVLFFAGWQLLSVVVLPRIDANLVTLMPPPTAVAAGAWELIQSGDLAKHFWASLKREAIAFAYASVAIPIGLLMGWSKTAQNLFEPIFEMLRPIPPIAWIPLAILWFGIGDRPAVFIIFIGSVLSMLLGVTAAAQRADKRLVQAGLVLGASRRQAMWLIVLPGLLPAVLAQLRLGLGLAWMAVIAAEMVAVRRGLGYLMIAARNLFRTDTVLVGMATVGLMGWLLDLSLRVLERRLLRWRRGMEAGGLFERGAPDQELP